MWLVSPSPRERARAILAACEGQRLERAERATRAVELADALLALSLEHTEAEDRRRAATLARLMDDRPGQLLTAALTDRLFRSRDPGRALGQVANLVRRFGVPQYMRLHERIALASAAALAASEAAPIARAVERRVRAEARPLLLDAEEHALSRHLAERHRQGARINVNQLGEALLGEREAEARVEGYLTLARKTGVDALSVKVSSVASQLNLLAFEATVELVASRLARIYRATLEHDGATRPLVMLDMEAYVHTELTVAALERALADRSLDAVRAGIVIQAYLPDSNALLSRLEGFSRARVAHGGAPLRLRLVKGANLAHERVESAKAGVHVPTFESKAEVDANYKRLLEAALPEAEQERVFALGVASHNLYELAYALVLSSERRAGSRMELELLEGMADPLRRALADLGVGVLLYAPICRDEEFNSGIAYLVRRLDENTSSDNYLRSSFAIARGGRERERAFMRERERFLSSVARVDAIDATPRRLLDRGFDRTREHAVVEAASYRGEMDTDFSRAENRTWIRRALEEARGGEAEPFGSFIAGSWQSRGVLRDGFDPSRPREIPYRFYCAEREDIERALAFAHDARGELTSSEERSHLLQACAQALRGARAELIAAMVLDGGKRAVEADVEVSEAIDFAEYYRASFRELMQSEKVELTPRGTILVTPPWNFPLAIPCSGIFAGLMAGCRVLFKPALETPLVAQRLMRILRRAGVAPHALQLLLCEDEVASELVRDARVATVILTGATSTARLFQRLRPGVRLLAETGGKNAYIVSAMSDRELAIRDVVHSAFGHAGQKCSAASLLICEEEVYGDPHFRATLRDAVESLPVGSAWDPSSFVTPLIRQPEQPLLRALTTLEPGEEWLVEPRIDRDNPRLVSPGVKLGVKAQSFTHTTELFGPVLGVMRARSIEHALELANGTGYGLTAGLASLDESEQALFCERMRAGNLYVNRTITGAIVRRQPFGGLENSGFGPGAKAGGPNYVAQLCRVTKRARHRSAPAPFPGAVEARVSVFERSLAAQSSALLRARIADYLEVLQSYFACEHDPEAVLGQFNRFRYLPDDILVRVERDAAALDVATSAIAGALVGAKLTLSIEPTFAPFRDASVLGHPLYVESGERLAARTLPARRMRLLGSRTALHDRLNEACGIHIADEPVLDSGRFELLHYLREQSVSIEYHRYGNLGPHGEVDARPPQP